MDTPLPHKISFSIIRKHNSANQAKTADGYTVHRSDVIFFDGRLVKCSPYDNHFVYVDPSKKIGRWTTMCSCGSPAVVAGYKAYARDASPTTSAESTVPGEMVVCYIHAITGRHADGSQ